MQNTQHLLIAGFVALLVVLGAINFKYFPLGFMGVMRNPENRPRIDRSRFKAYFTWVVGLTVLFGIYNLAVTRDLGLVAEATGAELFFLLAGLQRVILYKNDKSHT